MYTEKVMDHFRNPRNMGEIENPDSVGKVGNPVCGDMMHLYLRVSENSGGFRIDDIKFKTFGCASAIATSSVITEIVKGQNFDKALKLRKDEIIRVLEDLPPQKVHCSILAIDALHEAIYQFYKKRGMNITDSLEKTHIRVTKHTNGESHHH